MPDKSSKKLVYRAQALHQNVAPLLKEQARLPPANVHQLRVSVKELRALWQVLKPLLAKRQADDADRSIGRAAKLLAGVRDQQVQLNTLDQRISKAGAEELPALRRARKQLITQAAGTKEAVMTADIVSLFAQDLERWQTLGLSFDRGELVGEGYGRLYRKARKCYLQAVESGSTEDWHRLRRWTKYLALVTPVIVEDSDANAVAKRYSDLAEKLGDLHDLEVLAAGLRSLPDQDSLSTRQAIEVMEKRTDALQRKCCKKAKRLFSTQKKSNATKSALPA